jgi:hypothetical protein
VHIEDLYNHKQQIVNSGNVTFMKIEMKFGFPLSIQDKKDDNNDDDVIDDKKNEWWGDNDDDDDGLQ